LKVAADLCIADKKTDLNSVFQMADKIVSWVMDDKAGEKVDDGFTSVKKQEQSKGDDLPF
jgi:hypothetical protein